MLCAPVRSALVGSQAQVCLVMELADSNEMYWRCQEIWIESRFTRPGVNILILFLERLFWSFTSYFESCNSGHGTISLGLYSAINMIFSNNFGNEILAMQ